MYPLKYCKIYEKPEDYKPPESYNLYNNVTYPNLNCIDYAARPQNYTLSMHDNWDAITMNDDGHIAVVTNKRYGCEWWGTFFGFDQSDNLKLEHAKFSYPGQDLITKIKYANSNILLVGFADGRLDAWSTIAADGKKDKSYSLYKIRSETAHLDAINHLSVFKTDTNKAFTTCLDHKLTVWDLSRADLSAINHFNCAHNNEISGTDTPYEMDQVFVTCARDGVAKLWDIRQVRPATTIYKNNSMVLTAITCAEQTDSSTNDKTIYLGDFDGKVHSMDLRVPKQLMQTACANLEDSTVTQILQNGKHLAIIGNQPATVKIIKLPEHSLIYEYKANSAEEYINDALWRDEETLLTVGQKRKFNLHKIPKEESEQESSQSPDSTDSKETLKNLEEI